MQPSSKRMIFKHCPKPLQLIRKNMVLCIAMFLAVISILFVHPDKKYLAYFDVRTLTCLFCTLAVVCALKNIGFFSFLANKIIVLTGSLRTAVLALVIITFLGSMLLANDMALLTFLPLGYSILHSTGKDRHMAFVFILQNIAANLGGMLTPFGNPQNLYLYSKYQISNSDFLSIMAPPFLLSVVLIIVCVLFLKNEPLVLEEQTLQKPPRGKTILYLLLFIFSIIIVFRLIPFWIGLLVIPVFVLIADRNALLRVDYALLGTFVCFFVFSGNIARIEIVQELFTELLSHNVLLISVLSCQCISNVPTAILLSQFTDQYRALLLGVNIGGTGTLIASLASLITFREYTAHNPKKSGQYLLLFSVINFAFLIILTIFCSVIS